MLEFRDIVVTALARAVEEKHKRILLCSVVVQRFEKAVVQLPSGASGKGPRLIFLGWVLCLGVLGECRRGDGEESGECE